MQNKLKVVEEDQQSSNTMAEDLKRVITRMERLAEEKKAIADDMTSVLAEAKASGLDVKTIRTILAMRQKEPHQIQAEEALLDIYCAALGMSQ